MRPYLNLEALYRQVERRRRPRGIDLADRGEDVLLLLQSHLGPTLYRLGYDFHDVLQEVYKGILARNQGTSAFDPRRASFSTYVVMVCRSVFLNYHKREQKRRKRERVGAWTIQDGQWVSGDVGEQAVDEWSEEGAGECLEDLADYITERADAWRQNATLYQDARLAREALPLVYEGKRRGEIAEELGVSMPAVGRALSYLRQVAADWSG